MTGLDEFRYAMTGGNRYRDTSTLTVLERTYQSGQGGTSNFPDKTYYDPDSDATTYPGGTTITFQNPGKGSKGLDLTECRCYRDADLQYIQSCRSGLRVDDHRLRRSYTCTAWTGNGSTTPYRCTAVTPVGPESSRPASRR